MYLVSKTFFDELENRTPVRTIILGVVDTDDEEVVTDWIMNNLSMKSIYHKAYDGNIYPQFKFHKVEVLA